MKLGCSTTVDSPRDCNHNPSLGTMHMSYVPRDLVIDDSLVNDIQIPFTHSKPFTSSKTLTLKRNPSRDLYSDDDSCSLKNLSSRDKNFDDGSSLLSSLPRDQDSAPSLKAYVSKKHMDMDDPNPIPMETFEGDMPRDHNSGNDSINLISSETIHSNDPDHLLSSGINVSSMVSHQTIPNSSTSSETLPNHLKYNPPNLVIPDGYKWIFIHGGWTLIPCINTEEFYDQDPSPQKTSLDIPSDEELLDWGEDDDFLTEEIAEDEHFLDDTIINPSDNDLNSVSQLLDQQTDPLPDQVRADDESLVDVAPIVTPDPTSKDITLKLIRRSDRNKKPSGR